MEELLRLAIQDFNESLKLSIAQYYEIDLKNVEIKASPDGTFEAFKGDELVLKFRQPVVTNDPDSETIDYKFSAFKHP